MEIAANGAPDCRAPTALSLARKLCPMGGQIWALKSLENFVDPWLRSLRDDLIVIDLLAPVKRLGSSVYFDFVISSSLPAGSTGPETLPQNGPTICPGPTSRKSLILIFERLKSVCRPRLTPYLGDNMMQPLHLDEIDQVSGGDYWSDLFLTYISENPGNGTSSEQPTPPPWWGDYSSQQWLDYLSAHPHGY